MNTDSFTLEIILQAAQEHLDYLNYHGCVDGSLATAIKTIESSLDNTKVRFYAKGLHGWGLDASPDEVTSIDGIRNAIDRAGEYQRSHDNPIEQYSIFREEISTEVDEFGRLVNRSTVETRIEVYPAEIPGDPYYMVIRDKDQIPNKVGSYDVVRMVKFCEKTPGSYVKNLKTGEIVYRCSKQ